jgi:hydrogenase maturation factor HypF (carbamoyltransferase family)
MNEVEKIVLEIEDLQKDWEGVLADLRNTKSTEGQRIKKEKLIAKIKSLKKRLTESVAECNLNTDLDADLDTDSSLGLDKKLSENGRVDKLDLIYKTCVSTQSVVVESLILGVKKAIKIASDKNQKIGSIGLSGGVSANPLLRSRMQKIGDDLGVPVFIPNLKLTGDNAVMIALSGLGQEFEKGDQK